MTLFEGNRGLKYIILFQDGYSKIVGEECLKMIQSKFESSFGQDEIVLASSFDLNKNKNFQEFLKETIVYKHSFLIIQEEYTSKGVDKTDRVIEGMNKLTEDLTETTYEIVKRDSKIDEMVEKSLKMSDLSNSFLDSVRQNLNLILLEY